MALDSIVVVTVKFFPELAACLRSTHCVCSSFGFDESCKGGVVESGQWACDIITC